MTPSPDPSAEDRAEEVRAEEVRAEEVRAEEVRAEEVRAEEVRAEEVRAEEVRAEEVRAELEHRDPHEVPTYEPYRSTASQGQLPEPERSAVPHLPGTAGSDWLPQPDGSVVPHLPGPDDVDRLAGAPRRVPFTHRLAVGNLSPVGVFVLIVLSTAPMALWLLVPGALVAGLVVGSLALGSRYVIRYRHWVPVLRDGQVAQVVGAVPSAAGARFTSVPLRQARGWDARWQAYTGQGYRTEVSYTVAGGEGVLVLFGAPYDGGVVLADPHRPDRALCVSQLPFSVRPDEQGQVRGGLTAFGWVSVLLTPGATVAMVALLVSRLV